MFLWTRGPLFFAFIEEIVKESSVCPEVIFIARFEGGWSVDTLEKCRKLFLVYSKSATLLRILGQSENEVPDFLLSWSHYLILMRITNDAERNFYEIECANQHWGVRQLQRQVGSCLYERLALSRDKDEVMRLAKEGQTVEKSSDVIKRV